MASDNSSGVCERTIDGIVLREIDGEPCVHDLQVGERLELSRPRNVRKLIARGLASGRLKLGVDVFCSTVEQNTGARGRGRPSDDYWLTRSGVMLVATMSDTDKAHELVRFMVSVFERYLRGELGGAMSGDAIAKALDAQSIVLRDVTARQDNHHGALVTLQTELVRLHREASDDRAYMRAELMLAHEKMWDANANAHAAMLKASDDRGRELREGHDRLINADRELWKEMKAGRDSVDKTFAGYDSLARRLGWHEENAPIDGVITAKQYCELQAGIKRIVDMEVLAGKKSAGVIRRSVYNELGETVRWGGNAQPWRMLPAQRISDARTYLRRRYKLALEAVPVDKRNGATQGDLFEAFVRATTPPKETKH
jgi:hypothetical protein